MPGITAPFPDVFDPAGFTNNVKLTDLKRWRESEVTHGRVAMLAALGFIVGEQLEDFPAFVNYDGHITGTRWFSPRAARLRLSGRSRRSSALPDSAPMLRQFIL